MRRMCLPGETALQEPGMRIFFMRSVLRKKSRSLRSAVKYSRMQYATIGSDLANITVQYLAEKLGLPGNSSACIENSTNKFAMRTAFQKAGIPVPFFQAVSVGDRVVSGELSGYCKAHRPFRKQGHNKGLYPGRAGTGHHTGGRTVF